MILRQNSSFYLFNEEIFTFLNGYLLSTICLLGIFANMLNYTVFSRKELKDLTFKYNKVNSLSNIFCLVIGLFFSQYGYSQSNIEFFHQLYAFSFLFLKEIFSIWSIFIQITICLYRILLVTNHSSIRCLKNYKSISACLIVLAGLLPLIPILISKESGLIFLRKHAASVSKKIEIIAYVTMLKGFICSIIIIGLSMFTILKLKRHFKKSKRQ